MPIFATNYYYYYYYYYYYLNYPLIPATGDRAGVLRTVTVGVDKDALASPASGY